MFLIYINDLYCVAGLWNGEVNFISYADDSAVICEGKSWSEIEILANTAINKVYSWMNSKILSVYTEKTKHITFGAKINSVPKYTQIIIHKHIKDTLCNCLPLKRVTSIMYLGITVDYRMK